MAEGTTKGADFVRVVPDQMHQLEVVKVENPMRSSISDRRSVRSHSMKMPARRVLTPFSGRVTRLIAKVGDQVKRGDPLLEIDSPEQVPPQNEFIAAQGARNKARSQLNLAQIVEKRARDLYEGKAAPFKDLQQAEAQLAAAESDMRSTETAFEAARIRLRILGHADAEISELEQKGTISRVTRITAPIDGTVISRKVGPGQHVKSDSGEALYVIADLSTMWLKAQIFEQDIAFVRIGQEIEAKVAAAPNRTFKARIATIGSASDLTTRRVMVRSEIGNPDGVLKSEMFATFKIEHRRAIGHTGRADRRGDPRRRPCDGVGRNRADAVQAPRGRHRDPAERPDADTPGSRCRRTGGLARRDLRRQRVASMTCGPEHFDAA